MKKVEGNDKRYPMLISVFEHGGIKCYCCMIITCQYDTTCSKNRPRMNANLMQLKDSKNWKVTVLYFSFQGGGWGNQQGGYGGGNQGGYPGSQNWGGFR